MKAKRKITMKSTLTGVVRTKEIVMTDKQYEDYTGGEILIQNIFPDLNIDDREFLITGITAEEWEKYMKDPKQ